MEAQNTPHPFVIHLKMELPSMRGTEMKIPNGNRARKLIPMALWAVAMLSVTSTVRAGTIDFNPTGTNATPTLTIGGIDLAVGNALAVNALPLTVGETFQLDYQATVSGLINPNGLTTPLPTPGSPYQITAVGSFTEIVDFVSADKSIATFRVAPTQSSNSFFELYYNPAVIANNLAGTGFNQGTLILAGKPSVPSASVGVYSLSTDAQGNPVITQFDQFVNNDYPNTNTVSGSGSSMLSADVTFVNPDFIKSPLQQITFNSSLVTPFGEVDPSRLFTGLPGTGAPNVTPHLGATNGLSGPDFQFQADANFSFLVPEPASFIQAGLGLLGVLGAAVAVKVRR